MNKEIDKKRNIIDAYFRKFSKEYNITQDYIIEAVNRVRYKTKHKKGDLNGFFIN